ncbi:MAG: anti-sigma factor family protein [Candidatus Hinthialibacter sp.]
MKREDLEHYMASQLYGELSKEGQRNLNEWLDAHPDDRAEFEELRRTHALLNRLRAQQEEHESIIEGLPMRSQPRWNWRGWALAAAASFALLLFAGTQGLIVQIGSFRIGLGAAPASQDMRELIRQELAAHYKPVVDELVETVDFVQTAHDMFVRRQTELEQSFADLSAIQKIQERKVELALNELVDGIDERLRTYLAAVKYPAYTAYPVSGPNYQ